MEWALSRLMNEVIKNRIDRVFNARDFYLEIVWVSVSASVQKGLLRE